MTCLKAMATAPRDGTPICLVYSDLWAIEIGFWGEPEYEGEDNEARWFQADGSDEIIRSEDRLAGWFDLPDDMRVILTARMGNPAA